MRRCILQQVGGCWFSLNPSWPVITNYCPDVCSDYCCCHLTALCCILTLEHLCCLPPGPGSGRLRREGGSGASRRLLWGEGEQSVGQSLSCSTRAPRYNARRGAPPPPAADTAEPPLTSRPLSLKLLSPLIITCNSKYLSVWISFSYSFAFDLEWQCVNFNTLETSYTKLREYSIGIGVFFTNNKHCVWFLLGFFYSCTIAHLFVFFLWSKLTLVLRTPIP